MGIGLLPLVFAFFRAPSDDEQATASMIAYFSY
jgi:hypothetical protein